MEISGEISAQDLEIAWERAVKKAMAETELPGFRKGQAPEAMVIRKVGEDRLLHRAAEFALGEAWPNVLKENTIQAIGLPDMQVLKLARGNPLEWKARVAIMPEIKLPDYHVIAKQTRTQSISISQNDDISRNSDAGDDISKNDGLDGALSDENKIKENKTEEDSLEKINPHTNNIGVGIKEKRRLALLEAITEQSTIDLPAVLKETEKIKMAQELRAGLESIGLKWEDYLAHIKKNEQGIRDGFDGEAEKRARFGLVLREIAKREHIDPSPQEVEERVRHMLPAYTAEEQKHLDKNRLESYAYGIIRNEKVFEFLERVVSSM